MGIGVRRFLVIVGLMLFLFCGAWILWHKDQIRGPGDLFRLMGHQISRLGGGAVSQYAPYRGHATNVIRIGSFNAHRFNEAKMKDERVAAVMANIISQFDVLAIQEIDNSSPFAMKRFLRRLNSTGRQFQIVTGSNQPGIGPDQQSAILYDASTIELEDQQFYHVNDPDEVMVRDPLVAWFRTRNSGDQAFTFTLVNVHLEPQSPANEVLRISEIFRAVRNDGRNEDDVILAGDFGVSAMQLNQMAIAQGLQAVNVDLPTNTNGSEQFDNFMLDPLATSEFTGETGIYDFLKIYNLTLQQALTISDHVPVWAEFEVTENGTIGQFATRAQVPNKVANQVPGENQAGNLAR